MFYNSLSPGIICDSDGGKCELNTQAKEKLSLEKIDNIYEVFPGINLTENPPKFTARDCWGVDHILRCTFFNESNRWLIEIDKDDLRNWELFIEDQKILHEISLELYKCKSEKELYKKIVENSISKLKIDRIGILLFSIEDNLMCGSWGTDEYGKVVDQSDFRSNLDNEKWALEALKRKNYVAVQYNYTLRDRERDIGVGWNSVSAFYDDDKPVGWIACDNYFSHKSLPPWKKEILGELGRIVGRLVSRLRQENRLQEMVDERTKELKESQEHLIESEKMASLGALVAGISHELNTPVGIALTAASYISDSSEHIKGKVDSDTVKKTELIKFLNDNIQSGNITVASLRKVAELVSSFKQLAVDQVSEKKRDINIYDIVNVICVSFSHKFKERNITLDNYVDKSVNIYSYAGDFVQIFTNLIQNSIDHGFENKERGVISITSIRKGDRLIFDYKDDGIGIENEDLNRVFEPFYTTKRFVGGTGLGLSIIYNLVTKLGGMINISNSNPGLHVHINFDYLKLV